MKPLRAASVQFQHTPGDLAANMAKVESFVREAAAQQVELIVFPEMCLTGYWHVRNLSREAIEALSEKVPTGPSSQKLLELAGANKMIVGAGLIESDPTSGKLYNTYVVALPDGRIFSHRKIHTFLR